MTLPKCLRSKAVITWLGLLLAMIAIRSAYSLFPASDVDGGTYLVNAQYILEGTYFFPQVLDFPQLYRTPTYPLFVAAILQLTGSSIYAVACVQHGLGILTAVIIYFLTLRIWGRKSTALISSAFAGLHFHFVYYESYILSESLTIFLAYLALYLVIYLRQSSVKPYSVWMLGGIMTAAAGLCRPEFALMGVLCAAFLWLAPSKTSKHPALRSAVYMLPVVLAVGGWMLRNGTLFHYRGLTPNSRITFFDGPAGKSIDRDRISADFIHTVARNYDYPAGGGNKLVFLLQNHGLEYPRSSRKIGRLALDGVRRNPGVYIRHAVKNLYNILTIDTGCPPRGITETIPDLFNRDFQQTHPFVNRLLRLCGRVDGFLESIFMVPLFFAGVFFSLRVRPRNMDSLLILLNCCYLLFVYSFLSPGGMRYRVVIEPAMGIFAAYALSCLVEYFLRGKLPGSPVKRTGHHGDSLSAGKSPWLVWAPRVVCCAAAVCFIWFAAGLIRAKSARLEKTRPVTELLRRNPQDETAWLALGNILAAQGNLKKAMDCVDTVLAFNPKNKEALHDRGLIHFRSGNGYLALDDLVRAASIKPGEPDSYFNMAVIYNLLGDTDMSINNLSRFLELGSPSMPLYAYAVRMRADLSSKRSSPR